MKKLIRPKTLIPIILAAAILAALLAFGDFGKVLTLMAGFNRLYLVYFMLLMLGYEIVRCVQWHYLLTKIGINVPVRTQVFVFALGEVTKSLPIGNYFQNYLLAESKGTDFGLSSAATTLIVLIEVIVSLVGVLILGVGSFTPWLRPVVIIGVAAVVFFAWLFHKLHNSSAPPKWMTKRKWLRKTLDEFKHFQEGAKTILKPGIMAVAIVLGAVYLVIAGAALFIIAKGLGMNTSFGDVLAVYFFSLAIGLIFPLPVDVGVLEISGVGAFLAVGATKTAAVGATLINRVLSILASIIIAAVAALILHSEFRAAMRSRKGQRKDETPKPSTSEHDDSTDAATDDRQAATA